MGGRGGYSIRKAASSTGFTKGTPTAVTKASTTSDRVRGSFGGGSDSGRQTEASMLAEFSSWRNKLSEAQVTAIARYTNGDYRDINNVLRGKTKGDADTRAQVKNLKSAFNHALSKNVTSYRGTGTTDAETLKGMTTVGGVFRDKGAFSTSISRTVAQSWAGSKPNAVVFTIRLPKGYKGAAFVQSISGHKNEKELLIKPGQNWKVLKQLKPLGAYSKTPHYLITPV